MTAAIDGAGADFTCAGGAVHRCVRPFAAVHMTAGHNAVRRSGPGQNLALEVLWPKWVVLITGSTGLHYMLSALSNRSVTPSLA